VRFQLGDYVPYLLDRAGGQFAHAFNRALEGYGVTLAMWRVMAALLNGGEQRLGDIARLTGIELSTLSRIVAAMDAKGLIIRRRSGEDARAVLVSLTANGRGIADSIVPLALDTESSATAGMSDDEVRTLKALLVRMFGNLAGEGMVVARQ
jgi:DNA-binding MarR family transcriptional regulator